MSTANNGGAAFPRDEIHDQYPLPGEKVCRHLHAEEGMALRDYFAAHAPAMPPALREMAKIAEKADGRDTSDFGAFARYEAMWHWAYADAMLKARTA